MSGLVERKKVTTLDKIRKYYLKGPDSVKLTAKQEEIRVWIYKAWNLLINYHSNEQAMRVIMTEGVSRAQAYRYVNDAQSIFGNPMQNQHEAKRYLIEEDLIRLQQRAIKDKDGYLELKVISQRIKIAGFDKAKDPKFDPEKLKAQVYIIKPHPTVLAAIERAKDGGLYDMNTQNIEDIDFELISDDEFKQEDQMLEEDEE